MLFFKKGVIAMDRKNNATCSICGKPYYKCMACNDMVQNRPWQIYTDNADCYKVFQIIRGYNTKIYTKEEAKARLQMVDLSDFNNFRDHIKKIINDIMADDNNVLDGNNTVITESKAVRRKKAHEVVENELSEILEIAEDVTSKSVEVHPSYMAEEKSSDIVGAE